MVCGGGSYACGGGVRGGELQPDGADAVPWGDNGIAESVAAVLREAEGAGAMLLRLHQ